MEECPSNLLWLFVRCFGLHVAGEPPAVQFALGGSRPQQGPFTQSWNGLIVYNPYGQQQQVALASFWSFETGHFSLWLLKLQQQVGS